MRMYTLDKHRWRKFSDINREFALFELVTDDNQSILDVGFSDGGVLEVSFDDKVVGLVIEWSRLQEIIEEGRKLAEQDR